MFAVALLLDAADSFEFEIYPNPDRDLLGLPFPATDFGLE